MSSLASDSATVELSGQIEQVVGEVKSAVREVQKDATGPRPLTITEVTLTLQAALTKNAGGNFSFTLFGHSFGGGVTLTTADTQTIEITLKPSDAGAMAFGADTVSAQLVEAMRAIRASVEAAAASSPRMQMTEASIELNFQIDKDGKIDFIVAGEASKTNVQTVKLTMAPG